MKKLFAILALAIPLVALAGTIEGRTSTGTLNQAAVTAASTAPAATDKALVVGQTPNGGNPCHNPSASLQMAAGSTSGTTSVQIIALSGSTKIYVCSLVVVGVSGTTPTFSLTYGTGSNCGTGNNVILGAWGQAANTVYSFPFPLAVTPAGQALCYIQTGTTPISRYVLTYVQQ